ncbi:Monooxygenase asqM [Lachnellula suecica]|uniref:Monooxygenase asqM n=1 Tax=Lachnellula suecica TaxID=602035 RepID=A0A8T9BXK7_9HELO|nr:Monooxygenase asqM [Lachnellula suecica]
MYSVNYHTIMVADIAIVGGGPSGLALAGILEKAGFSYIVYERSARDHPPRGGCLDLHEGSGQLAMQEAGCYEKFKEYGRDGDFTIHQLWTDQGENIAKWGEGEDQPELDREEIKQALLTTIPKEKILWSKTCSSSKRDESGNVVLSFEDGTTATGFKLVVGADGAFSQIRHLVTPTKPEYAGMAFWTGEIHESNPFYPTVEKMARKGPMVVIGRSTMIWNQRQGDGHYRLDLGFERPEDFTETSKVDLSDPEAVKKLMLSDEFFGGHAEEIKAIIEAIDSPFHPWPMYNMPPASLNWKPAKTVALIGDAAHVTTPFVGEGVNLAMKDSIVLVHKLKEFGISQEAIAEYEKDMFPRAREIIERSIASGKLYFSWDALRAVKEANVPF